MIKTILKYGLIGGLAMVAYLNITYETGIMYSQTWLAYLATMAVVLIPISIFLALRELKRKQYNGCLPFLPSLVGGVAIAVLGAAVYCLFYFVDMQFFNQRQMRETIEMQAEQLRTTGTPEPEITAKVQKMRTAHLTITPYKNILFWYARMGVLYACAAWLLLNIKQLKNKLYDKNNSTQNPNSA
jgi:hypothetical protein